MKRFSIITKDLTKCIECGLNNVELHEIFYGKNNRTKSIKYGLVIPLCKARHHQGNLIGIHQDSKLCDKWHKIAQKKAMEFYDWSEDDFRKIFGKNYL